MTSDTATAPSRRRSSQIGSNETLDNALSLAPQLESSGLRIRDARADFAANNFPEHDRDSTVKANPAIVASEVASQMSFLRKLKFHYIEQNAKDKYLKMVMNDTPPLIEGHDNELLRAENAKKKEALKSQKTKLSQAYADIRQAAPKLESEYHQAHARITEVSTLAQQFLDARLALSRLRSAHPFPRLTVRQAVAQLETQEVQLLELEEESNEVARQVDAAKERVKDRAKEVERLKIERANAEAEVKATRGEGEDERAIALYEWFTASLAFSQNLFSLKAVQSISENEIRLTYTVSPDVDDRRIRSTPRTVTLALVFVPDTRRLADAHVVSGPDLDYADVIGSHVQANDAPGLIAAILARCRATP